MMQAADGVEASDKQSFLDQGYIVKRGFFKAGEVEDLLQEIKTAKLRDDAPDDLTKGAMLFRSNTFYHSPPIQKFISQQRIVDLLREIVGPDLWVRWDQAVAKGPGAGTFPWHQDNAYNGLLIEHFQFWIALTASDESNGALWVSPESHRSLLKHRVEGHEAVFSGDPEHKVLIESEPGDVVLFSSRLLHTTTPNVTKDRTRWAYVVEYMSLDAYDPFLKGPYFVVARNGVSAPGFIDRQPARSLASDMKHRFHRARQRIGV